MSGASAPTIGAIETTYQGIRFRSRLEARWAVFFDALRWPWEFEPEGYTNGTISYLPDFWLPEPEMFWEVKRDVFTLSDKELDAAINKAMMLAEVTDKNCKISFGFPTGKHGDTGRWGVVFPDGKDTVTLYSHLPRHIHDAAAEARAYRFWDPS